MNISSMPSHSKRWLRHRAIRFRLACLVAACVLPVWLAGGYLLYSSYQNRLALIERRMQETARALMLAADRELSNIQASLKSLATSPAIDSGDLAVFHNQALELLIEYPAADIIMADATGQQYINTYRPWGSILPKRNIPEAVRRVFETGKPRVSDLFRGAVTGRPLIGVDVAAMRDGRVAYDLAMTLPADRLTAILKQQKLPPEWVGVILDGKRVVVARTSALESFVGQRAAELPILRQTEDSAEGIAEGEDDEGVPILTAFSRSAQLGWTAEITVPKAVLMADLWQWTRWMSAMTASVLLAGLLVAFIMGRGVVRDVWKLSEGAKHIAGGDLGYRISMGGVTELAELARSFNDMAEALQGSYGRLEKSNRELQDFAHIASHDLQEPLRKIQAFGDRLRMESGHGLNEAASDSLGRMENAAGRMQELIDALLNYSRFTRTERPSQTVDLQTAAETVIVDLETLMAETGGRIEFAGRLPAIEANMVQMRQLFQNLFSNALKYHQPDSPPEVLVSGRLLLGANGEDMCEISVADNGIGFDEKYLPKIFSPFQRLHGGKQYPGTGMGLAIARRIAEGHGGSVTARSAPGQGATFIVTLPSRQDDEKPGHSSSRAG